MSQFDVIHITNVIVITCQCDELAQYSLLQLNVAPSFPSMRMGAQGGGRPDAIYPTCILGLVPKRLVC